MRIYPKDKYHRCYEYDTETNRVKVKKLLSVYGESTDLLIKEIKETAEGLEDCVWEVTEDYDVYVLSVEGWRSPTEKEEKEIAAALIKEKETQAQLKEYRIAEAERILREAGKL